MPEVIFLDTEVFIRNNFQYFQKDFGRILELVKSKKTVVLLTEIVVEEVRSHIKKRAKDAKRSIVEARKGASILHNLKPNFNCIFQNFAVDEVELELQNQFISFIEQGKLEVLSISSCNPSRIFKLYFSQEGVFGEGKKKTEFPDAFSLEAVNLHAEENKIDVSVISKDNDILEGCKHYPRLAYLDSIKTYLNWHFENEKEALSKALEEYVEENSSTVLGYINEHFINQFFYPNDLEGEVDAIDVTDVEVTSSNLVNLEESMAEFSLEVIVNFNASGFYEDYDYAIYDKEDEIWFGVQTIFFEQETEKKIEIELEISFEEKEKYEFEIVKLDLVPINGIPIEIEEKI